MTPEEFKPDIIGSLDLWVDAARFDQTEMIVVGDKQFIRKDKAMSMLVKWDEHNKPARAEELKNHAVEFAKWLHSNNLNYIPGIDKWAIQRGANGRADSKVGNLYDVFAIDQLYTLFNPKV